MNSLRPEILSAVAVVTKIFWDAMSCTLVYAYKRLGGNFCCHVQGRRECDLNLAVASTSKTFACLSTRLHGVMSQ